MERGWGTFTNVPFWREGQGRDLSKVWDANGDGGGGVGDGRGYVGWRNNESVRLVKQLIRAGNGLRWKMRRGVGTKGDCGAYGKGRGYL